MEFRAALIHIAVAIVIGAVVAACTPARWVAASLWVSAAMMINGAIATIEDASPGGFDNPDGSGRIQGAGALAFKCAVIALALASLGFAVQFLWLAPP
ncbi:MAG: hypothetical protein EOO80_03745 [Oxalobacteraceae bacterium]|nr:MAG: hypothetical protein EOO80_03745 [Oxalobacteraceae bacterium]